MTSPSHRSRHSRQNRMSATMLPQQPVPPIQMGEPVMAADDLSHPIPSTHGGMLNTMPIQSDVWLYNTSPSSGAFTSLTEPDSLPDNGSTTWMGATPSTSILPWPTSYGHATPTPPLQGHPSVPQAWQGHVPSGPSFTPGTWDNMWSDGSGFYPDRVGSQEPFAPQPSGSMSVFDRNMQYEYSANSYDETELMQLDGGDLPYPAIEVHKYVHGMSQPQPEATFPMHQEALAMAGQDHQYTAPHYLSLPLMAADHTSSPTLDFPHNSNAGLASNDVTSRPQTPRPHQNALIPTDPHELKQLKRAADAYAAEQREWRHRQALIPTDPHELEQLKTVRAANAAEQRQQSYRQRVQQLTTILAQHAPSATQPEGPLLLDQLQGLRFGEARVLDEDGKCSYCGTKKVGRIASHFFGHVIKEVRAGFPRVDVGRTHILCTPAKLFTAFEFLEHPAFRCPCCSEERSTPDVVSRHLKTCKYNRDDQQRVEDWKRTADTYVNLAYKLLPMLGFTLVRRPVRGVGS